MRSRYVAFTLGDLDYIQRTCAGEALLKFDRTALARALPATQWLGLAIRATDGGGADDLTGTVTFDVRFREDGRMHMQTERSEFRRIDQAWRYIRGEVSVTTDANPRAGRNDPCPCGSGRKYKKCCGA
jgi:SEC-C motif-containing protein